MKVIKIETDNRGSVVIIEDDGWEYHVVKTFAGKYRGGEIHDGDQFNFVVSGNVKFTSKYDKIIEVVCHAGEVIKIPEGVAHMSKSLTDSIVLEWHKAGRKTEYYEPFREKVRNQ
jgi:cupin superfamily acireductone dioxygenase involved in methionine salvage